MMTFMSCHLLGMSSTCTNPALYGYINQNLQLEITRSARDLKEWLSLETIRIVGTTVKIRTRGDNKVRGIDRIGFWTMRLSCTSLGYVASIAALC